MNTKPSKEDIVAQKELVKKLKLEFADILFGFLNKNTDLYRFHRKIVYEERKLNKMIKGRS